MVSKHSTTRFAFEGSGGALSRASLQTLAANAAGDECGVGAIWWNVRARLRDRLGDARFENWIARLELIAEVDGEILIASTTEVDRDRVNREFKHLIQQAWRELDGQGRHITIEARQRIPADVLALAEPMPSASPANAEARAEPPLRGPTTDSLSEEGNGPDNNLTLETFHVGDSNLVAFGLARRIAQGTSVAANVVTIVGPHGVGKSHLQKGIEAALRASGRQDVLYIGSEEFFVTYIEGVKRKDTADQRTMMRKARVLLIDDFHMICSKPGTLNELFSHIRAVTSAGGLVVLTSDKPPSALEHLDDRMRDEIQGGVVAVIALPEPALRRRIVRAKADDIARNEPEFRFEDEWANAVADRLAVSGRVLSGVVQSVFCNTSLAGAPLTWGAVEAQIREIQGVATLRMPKIDTIKDVTARHYHITKLDLESECRKRQFALPRQYAMYLARKITGRSFPYIGRMFGDRDHTTVLFAFKKISRMVEAEPAIADELRGLEQRILSDPRNRSAN
jgi:chromosomal replication initiator protein